MGTEVTMVEPSELVVVRFPKAVEVEVLVVELLLFAERALLVVRVAELED